MGRLGEYMSLPAGDESIRDVFLEQIMPNYEEFLRRAANEAGYALLGAREVLSAEC